MAVPGTQTSATSGLRPELMCLWQRAQRAEVVVDLRGPRQKRKDLPGREVLPQDLQDRPLLSTADFLHLEAGCSLEPVEELQRLLGQEDWQIAWTKALENGTDFRFLDIPTGTLWTLRDKTPHGFVGIEVFEDVTVALEGLEERTEGSFSEIEGDVAFLVGERKDWRKPEKRAALLTEFRVLQTCLKSLSMVVFAYPYLLGRQPLGAARVKSWLEVLYYATERAGRLKVLAEHYCCLADLAGSSGDQIEAQRGFRYRRIIDNAFALWGELSSLRNQFGAFPLTTYDSLEQLLFSTRVYDVLLGRSPWSMPGAIRERLMPAFLPTWASFVGIEAGTSPASVSQLHYFLQRHYDSGVQDVLSALKGNGVPVRELNVGGQAGILLINNEEALPCSVIDLWRMERIVLRIKESLLPVLAEVINVGNGIMGRGKEEEEKVEMGERIMGQLSELYSKLEWIMFFVEEGRPAPGLPDDRLAKVAKWRGAIGAAVEAVAGLIALVEGHFNIAKDSKPASPEAGPKTQEAVKIAEGLRIVLKALLAGRDYVNGIKLEHGEKVAFAELQKQFEAALPAGMKLQFNLNGVTAEEGVYIAPLCFLAVIESLLANFKEHGKPPSDFVLEISRDKGTINVKVRNWQPFAQEMLAGVPIPVPGSRKVTTREVQRLFVRQGEDAARQVPSDGWGWTVRETVEFAQGNVKIDNEGDEGVLSFSLPYSA